MTASPTTVSRLPLAAAALALLGEGGSAAAVAERFTALGARLDDGVADDLLTELLDLGLVRVARTEHGGSWFVPTPLGSQAVAGGIAGPPSVALGDLETLRTELLSTIAHEMRTPLTAVRTSVGLLRDPASEPTDEQRETLLATIERNADRMQRIVGDILDLARFRAGSIRLQLRRFDACDLARAVLASIQPLADHDRQRLVLRGCDGETAVFGDRRRLEQALLNLVSNARRFSARGGEVRVAVAADGELVRWRVEDDGPGVPVEDQARLFERFFVGRSDRHAALEGVGLGLPTALAIAQAHGGTIDVESEVGRGSAFTLVVPIDGPAEAD
jgi:signal transduction histidine kinase